MQVFLLVLTVTTILGSMIGAMQTGAKIWQGGVVALFGLSAIGLFHILMSFIYPGLATASEFAASQVVLDRQQTAGVAGGALMMTIISGAFLAVAT